MKSLLAGINSIINSKSIKSVENFSRLAVNGETYSDPQKMAIFVNVSSHVCSETPRMKSRHLIGLAQVPFF